MIKKHFGIVMSCITITCYSQKKFTFSPERPKPGDLITFTYQPSGDIANTQVVPTAIGYFHKEEKGFIAEDIELVRKGDRFIGNVQTKPSTVLLTLSFSVDGKYDNNFNNGYYVHLYENDKLIKGSNRQLSFFYSFIGYNAGLSSDVEKALQALGNEFELYPEQKSKFISTYISYLVQLKKPDFLTVALKEIEVFHKNGLKQESDYQQLEGIYRIIKMPEQSKFIADLKKEKFPNGKWNVNEEIQKFFREGDVNKKKELFAQMIMKAESGGENWKEIKDNISIYKVQLIGASIRAKKWDEFNKLIGEIEIKERASHYNTVAWQMQEAGENLEYAEEISRLAVEGAKMARLNSSAPKPDHLSVSQWKTRNEYNYAAYADTYAMVLYRMGKYKKAFSYAKEAELIYKGKNASQNNTYALLAEKVLPAKKYKKELEEFVKNGKATTEIKDILKKVFIKDTKSEKGYDEYVAGLEQEYYNNMIAELRKAMLDEVAPSFAMLDLGGKKVSMADLKGKVVVVDFWATWCGPCKASFPGMQKMVIRYKDNPDIKFLFVDTWERVENKEKNAMDFMTENKYTFHVLMDNDNKVVEQFKVEGIPTKFVIDKEGKIRFRSIGYSGSDEALMSKLTAMINLTTNSQKAF